VPLRATKRASQEGRVLFAVVIAVGVIATLAWAAALVLFVIWLVGAI
jgi:hypothetical protein